MTINAILAHDQNFGIGLQNELPWPRSDADMKWFRDCTRGHVVVMGRKTWESLDSKKLPNRINVVVTRSRFNTGKAPDKVVSGTMSDILTNLEKEYPHLIIWVIGGAEIYQQALPMCDNIYVTEFKGVFESDKTVELPTYLIKGFVNIAKKEKENLTFNIWKRV